MSNVVSMFPEPDRAERLMEAADAGGIGVVVQFDTRHGSSLLFSLHGVLAPTAAAMAAVVEISARFSANADFRDAVEHFCIQLGTAVQYVEEPAWKFRPLSSEETAALYAGRDALGRSSTSPNRLISRRRRGLAWKHQPRRLLRTLAVARVL